MEQLRKFIHLITHQKKSRYLLIGVAGLALAILVAHQVWAASQQVQEPGGALMASGVIQAETVSIASEFGGRVASIPVAEGQTVAAGDLLVQFDTTLLDAQIEAAAAMVAVAEAGLAQAQAGARPGQITVAEAQLAQAQTGRAVAQQAVSDTLALVENPQEINLQIAVMQAQLDSTEHQLAQAMALRDAAEVGMNAFQEAYDEWDGGGRFTFPVASGSLDDIADALPPELSGLIPPDTEMPDLPDGTVEVDGWEVGIQNDRFTINKVIYIHFPIEAHLSSNSWWQAWAGVNARSAQQEGLEASLTNLYAQQANPIEWQARASEAQSALAQAEAYAVAAQAQVDGLQAGASAEQIAALEARLAQAQTGLAALQAQRAMLAVRAPTDGTIIDLVVRPAEVAAAGGTLLNMADLSAVTLKVYLPETELGRVAVGQTVQVTVDSFPGRVFEGQVVHIADQAEFTPRNVATQEERVNLVFAIEVSIPNADGSLKPGMPADALFGE